MLDKIKQDSLTDIVENRIFHYLKEKSYRPGDTFHGEKELAAMLQISRPVVREALSRFRMLGLLESRKKRGIVVAKPSIFKTLAKVLDPAFLTEEEQRDFSVLRITIELGLADLLALRVTDGDIAGLEAIVAREEDDPADFDRYLDCDYRFHTLLYRASGSQALESFQVLLCRHFSDRPRRLAARREDFHLRFEDPGQTSHRDVLTAIKTLQAETIQSTMRKHLTVHLKHLVPQREGRNVDP